MIDFICYSINNWEKRKARKQQFMLSLSKRDDVGRVLYIEPPLNFYRLLFFYFAETKTLENKRRWIRAIKFKIFPLSEKLFLFTPVFFIPFSFRIQFIYNLNLFFSCIVVKLKIKKIGFSNIILWLYHPFDYLIIKWFTNRILAVFDWAEDWAEYFIEFNRKKRDKIKFLETKIVKDVDIVFVVSQELLARAKKINKKSYRLFDGTDDEVFQKTSVYMPEDMKHIKKPILGYMGTISHRIDIELLEFLSKELSFISLVLIGDIHSQRLDISRLRNKGNVYFLGGKYYEELGDYAKCFDVCILPYKPALSRCFPTKLLDYLATGKPIVSSNLLEVDRFKHCVYIADSREEFISMITLALNENSFDLSKKRLEIAKHNTWEKRAGEIVKLIKTRLKNATL